MVALPSCFGGWSEESCLSVTFPLEFFREGGYCVYRNECYADLSTAISAAAAFFLKSRTEAGPKELVCLAGPFQGVQVGHPRTPRGRGSIKQTQEIPTPFVIAQRSLICTSLSSNSLYHHMDLCCA